MVLPAAVAGKVSSKYTFRFQVLQVTTSMSPPIDESRKREFSKLAASVDQRLRYFLLSLTSNPDDAEDVLQDSYEVAWRRFSDFEEGSNFYAWMARIAYNQARNFNRKRRRHQGLGLSEEVVADLAKTASGYSEFLEIRQQLLRECLEKLKPIDQALLIDSYRDEQPKADLARRYGIRGDLLPKRLFRLRKKLHDCVNRSLGREKHRP